MVAERPIDNEAAKDAMWPAKGSRAGQSKARTGHLVRRLSVEE